MNSNFGGGTVFKTMATMMNESEFQDLLAIAWRRPLKADEQAGWQAYLSAHPEAQAALEDELNLNRALATLPAVPVASNFTAAVITAAQRERPTRRLRSASWWNWLRAPLPVSKFAFAAMLLAVGLFSRHQYLHYARADRARSLAAVSQFAAFSDLNTLQHFDTISQLTVLPPVDVELLAALK